MPSSPVFVQKNFTPRSSLADRRELNVILFGLPDEGSIVVNEMFEFLVGKQMHIKDMVRLDRFKTSQSSSSPPHPILIKLCTAWDFKLILSCRGKLRDFHIKRLFLREDVAPDHKLRQRPLAAPSDKNGMPSSLAVRANPSLSGCAAASSTQAASLPSTGKSNTHSSLKHMSLSRSSRSA